MESGKFGPTDTIEKVQKRFSRKITLKNNCSQWRRYDFFRGGLQNS